MTPYNISTYFIGQKETGEVPEQDNPCFFHTSIRNTLRPFIEGTYPQLSFSNGLLCNGTVPWLVVTFSVTTLVICVCILTTTILTL